MDSRRYSETHLRTDSHPRNLVFYAILGRSLRRLWKVVHHVILLDEEILREIEDSKVSETDDRSGVAGVIAIFFPEILGLGYGFLQFSIIGSFASFPVNFLTLPVVLILLLLVFLKIFATSLTVGSGGSGGVFAPALVIGGYVGAFLWMIIHSVAPKSTPVPAPLVIVGMMALFAGVGRVPIAVILMVEEMTGNLSLIAPSMIAVVISYYLTGSKYTIYRSQVATRADSPAHRGEYNVPLMTRLFVADGMENNVSSLQEDDTVDKANLIMVEKGRMGIAILSKEKVVGIVTMSDVQRVSKEKSASTKVSEIMTRNLISVGPRDNLLEALRKMTTNSIGRLLVIDPDTGTLLGMITPTDVFKAYDTFVSSTMESNQTDRTN